MNVRNISKEPIGVRDKITPEVEEKPVTVKPGKTIEVSDDKARELVRDYPDHFELA